MSNSYNPMDSKLPGSFVHEILQARILEWVAISFPRGSSQPRTHQSTIAAVAAKSLQSCLTLCDPIDGSPPGSTIPGIVQARKLEWGAITFSYMALCCQVISVVSNSVRPHRWQPTRLHHPWDSLCRNTGVGCHFLLQYGIIMLNK